MRHIIETAFLGGLLLSSACQAANDAAWVSDSAAVATPGTKSAAAPASAATQSSIARDSMPIFVAVTQRTTMSGPPVQQPPLQVGVAAFEFSPDTGVLRVQPSMLEPSPDADVLIGVSSVLLTPDQSYENRELVQFPAAQPALFRILSSDADTGTVRLVYRSESYELPPGKSLVFEQVGGSAGTTTVITLIENHGRLSAIQLAPPDGSVR